MVGSNAEILDNICIGHPSILPDIAFVANGTVIGNLVTFAPGVVQVGLALGTSSVVMGRANTFARDTSIGQDVVIGPNGSFGDPLVTGDTVRIRKNTDFGAQTRIGSGVRIGRNVLLVLNNDVRSESELQPGVQILANQCIPADSYIERDVVVISSACPDAPSVEHQERQLHACQQSADRWQTVTACAHLASSSTQGCGTCFKPVAFNLA
ncbi:MAG: carbonic anhydrase/acetyltransferase-like protein (isoleucine patch superfamily) [Myxococcota bacterium]